MLNLQLLSHDSLFAKTTWKRAYELAFILVQKYNWKN